MHTSVSLSQLPKLGPQRYNPPVREGFQLGSIGARYFLVQLSFRSSLKRKKLSFRCAKGDTIEHGHSNLYHETARKEARKEKETLASAGVPPPHVLIPPDPVGANGDAFSGREAEVPRLFPAGGGLRPRRLPGSLRSPPVLHAQQSLLRSFIYTCI
jgi:hypothetical protein